jgi:hypothetical protein
VNTNFATIEPTTGYKKLSFLFSLSSASTAAIFKVVATSYSTYRVLSSRLNMGNESIFSILSVTIPFYLYSQLAFLMVAESGNAADANDFCRLSPGQIKLQLFAQIFALFFTINNIAMYIDNNLELMGAHIYTFIWLTICSLALFYTNQSSYYVLIKEWFKELRDSASANYVRGRGGELDQITKGCLLELWSAFCKFRATFFKAYATAGNFALLLKDTNIPVVLNLLFASISLILYVPSQFAAISKGKSAAPAIPVGKIEYVASSRHKFFEDEFDIARLVDVEPPGDEEMEQGVSLNALRHS